MAVLDDPTGTSSGAGRPTLPRPLRPPSELVPLLLLPVVLLAASAGLWPLWQRAPVLAAMTTLVVAVLVTTGLVLLTEPVQHALGFGLLLAGCLLPLSWCNEWGSGPLPVLSLLEGHGWLFLAGWALYRYPGPRLSTLERRSFQLMTGWVLVWPWALILTSRPDWRGYQPDAWWPALWPQLPAAQAATWAVDLGGVAVLALYGGLWVRRLATAPSPTRRRALPSAVAGIVGASSAALAPLADVSGFGGRAVELADTVATVGALAVPGAMLVAVASRYRARAGLPRLLVELARAASTRDAVHALRRALDDPGLVVGLWSGTDHAYLTDDGRPVTRPTVGERPVSTVPTAAGGPLALVIGSESHPGQPDPDLFAAATAAFGLSLQNARLLEATDRQLVDLRTATDEALTATLAAQAARAERHRIEQDLHDGAQMRFLALAPLIGAAQARTADPATSAALAEIRTELAGALGELRRLAHGTDAGPPGGGLAAAVAGLAASCPLPVAVDLPFRRLPATAEGAAYLVICEALANSLKHSDATRVAIDGSLTAGRLVVTVADDGCGGAAPAGGRGLAGMAGRAAAAGGRLTVTSPPGEGTTVTLDLPCG